MIDLKQGVLEKKARNSDTCPKCGEPKDNDGVGAPLVCWGDCWRDEATGLKYSNLDTEVWLKNNCPNL